MSKSNEERALSPYPDDTTLPVRKRKDADVPSWTPGVEYDETGGELRSRPRELPEGEAVSPAPEDAELLAEFGLDPTIWTVTNLKRSKWQSGDRWLEAYKASFKRRGQGFVLSPEETDDILVQYANVRRQRTRKRANDRLQSTLMVPVGDLQLGKEEGGGTAATIDRFGLLTQRVLEQLVDVGGVERLILPWLGDCIEGIVSQSGRNVARLDIPISEQVRVYRRLMMHQIATLSPWAEHVLIPVVPGNHDETYRQQIQPVTDSWAIEGASAVADALTLSGKYENVRWAFPDPEEVNVVVDVGTASNPLVMGFTHGHMWRPGQALKWWGNQSHGRQLMGQADMMVSAHLHHLHIQQTGGDRTWLQIPALDGGSAWYRRATGEDAPAGMVSVWLTPGEGSGWRGLTVHAE